MDKTIEDLSIENSNNLEEITISDEKESHWVAPYFVVDIIFNIFTRVPAHKVQEVRYSCKEWYDVMNSSRFTLTHLHHSNPSLIAIPIVMVLPVKEGVRYVRPDIIQIHEKKRLKPRKFVDNTCEFVDKTCKFVVDTCNGLVLLEDVVGNLYISNPATGQMLTFPPCVQRSECLDVLRALSYIDSTGEYKVVSVVKNKAGLLECEMIGLGSITRKMVSSPFGRILRWSLVQHNSITIKGLFHFMFCGAYKVHSRCESRYVVSFDIVEEKFYISEVPDFPNRNEKLHKMDGCLSVAVPNRKKICYRWEIWALKDPYGGEWCKQYSINLAVCGKKFHKVWPFTRLVATLENDRFWIITSPVSGFQFYIYDFQLQLLRPIEIDPIRSYIVRPHVESLVRCLP